MTRQEKDREKIIESLFSSMSISLLVDEEDLVELIDAVEGRLKRAMADAAISKPTYEEIEDVKNRLEKQAYG